MDMPVSDCRSKCKLKETICSGTSVHRARPASVFSEPIIKQSKSQSASKKMRDADRNPWLRKTPKPTYWKDFDNRMRALRWFGASMKRKKLPFTLYELHCHNLGTLADYYKGNIYMIQDELARCQAERSIPSATKRS